MTGNVERGPQGLNGLPPSESERISEITEGRLLRNMIAATTEYVEWRSHNFNEHPPSESDRASESTEGRLIRNKIAAMTTDVERGSHSPNEHSPSESDRTGESTEEKPVAPNNARPPFSFFREVAFVGTLVTAQITMLAGLSQGLSPALYIGSRFNVTNNGELSWYVASFALTVGTFILIAGRLGDMYGHKRIFILGYIAYGVWSMVAGAGYYLPTDKLFVVSRALQGLAASLILPNAVAILGRTYPPGLRKNLVFSLFGAAAPSGYMIGAAFSSLVAQFAPWSWEYFAMGLACFLFALCATWTLPIENVVSEGNFDWLGSISGVSGLILINVAWNQGPTVGWSTPYVYILLILGVLSMVVFVFVERRAEKPLLPVGVLNLWTGYTLAALACGWATFGIWLYYLWQFLQVLRGYSPLAVTAQSVPSAISGFASAAATAILISKIGVPLLMVLALTSFCGATIILATMPIQQTYWAQTFAAALVMPWGMEMSFPTAIIMASAAVPKQHQGIAASMVLTTTNYAISIGLGIAGTVASNVGSNGDVLATCRHAWYTGIGISGLGIVIAVVSALHQRKAGVVFEKH
jgi:MFS family permease